MATDLGKTLLIVNPVAQSGKSASALDSVTRFLRSNLGADSFSVTPTTHALHATSIAKEADGFDTVIAFGGDGIIHEVVNGLMARPSDERPILGVLPMGSGNDYARTLGMDFDVTAACRQLLEAQPQAVDVGCVNGEWFTETLSFGLDAAIAIDTMERRKRTGKTGASLYMESGFDQLMHHLDTHHYRVSFDGGQPVDGDAIIFAVQNGPYYGGGFKICPNASLTDGVFDVCIAHPPIGVLKACLVFLRAKDGKHVKSKNMEFVRASSLHIEFDAAPPAQTDGEKLTGSTFDITMAPAALRVLMPQRS